MGYRHLRERSYYEDIYDRGTVESARRDLAHFLDFKEGWLKQMPDDEHSSFRNTFHLNWIYMLLVGNHLLDNYDGRERYIGERMAEDKAKDERVADARLTTEPICRHCHKTGLRITSKMLHHKDGLDSPEEILFMLDCTSCGKMSAYWENGAVLEPRKEHCPECKAVLNKKSTQKNEVNITVYTCPSCSHTHKDELDLTIKEKELDPDYERDRAIFCLTEPKALEEHRDARRRYEGLAQMGREFKEKEENKHIYDAIAQLKRPKIAELIPLLAPTLQKAGYIEVSLDKPEIGRDVVIGFSCLDSKSDRRDYDSKQTLKKLVDKALKETNWRLMSEGIHYRLGYLSGRLRAYESEEDIKKLVMKSRKLKAKQGGSDSVSSRNQYVIKDKDGGDIIL